jgi:hypothetical protein
MSLGKSPRDSQETSLHYAFRSVNM